MPGKGGRSTHWPVTLGFLPREAASGNGAGISLRRWRPKMQKTSVPQTLKDYQTAEHTAVNELKKDLDSRDT